MEKNQQPVRLDGSHGFRPDARGHAAEEGFHSKKPKRNHVQGLSMCPSSSNTPSPVFAAWLESDLSVGREVDEIIPQCTYPVPDTPAPTRHPLHDDHQPQPPQRPSRVAALTDPLLPERLQGVTHPVAAVLLNLDALDPLVARHWDCATYAVHLVQIGRCDGALGVFVVELPRALDVVPLLGLVPPSRPVSPDHMVDPPLTALGLDVDGAVEGRQLCKPCKKTP
jgi:hypothetical protein